MGDGAVVFITDSIEAGDQTAAPIGATGDFNGWAINRPGKKSPYGLWGARKQRRQRDNQRAVEPIVRLISPESLSLVQTSSGRGFLLDPTGSFTVSGDSPCFTVEASPGAMHPISRIRIAFCRRNVKDFALGIPVNHES